MYPSKAWQVILYPTTPPVIGLAILKYLDGDPAAWLVLVTLCLISVMYLPYLIAIEKGWDEPMMQIIEPKRIPNLNTQSSDVQYADDVQSVSMDAEKYVAHTLINMQHVNKVDLTEKFWITGKHFDGSREQFALMLREWEQVGAVRRKSRAKNSPYVVADWNKIRKIVRG